MGNPVSLIYQIAFVGLLAAAAEWAFAKKGKSDYAKLVSAAGSVIMFCLILAFIRRGLMPEISAIFSIGF